MKMMFEFMLIDQMKKKKFQISNQGHLSLTQH